MSSEQIISMLKPREEVPSCVLSHTVNNEEHKSLSACDNEPNRGETVPILGGERTKDRSSENDTSAGILSSSNADYNRNVATDNFISDTPDVETVNGNVTNSAAAANKYKIHSTVYSDAELLAEDTEVLDSSRSGETEPFDSSSGGEAEPFVSINRGMAECEADKFLTPRGMKNVSARVVETEPLDSTRGVDSLLKSSTESLEDTLFTPNTSFFPLNSPSLRRTSPLPPAMASSLPFSLRPSSPAATTAPFSSPLPASAATSLPFTSLATSTPRSRLSSTPCSGPHGHRTLPTPSRPQPDISSTDGPMSLPVINSGSKSYDYLLKVLLVGDSDVGKQEIITGMEDGSLDSPYCSSTGAAYKTTIILIDGKKVKLHIWDTSGQGRFCTIIRSYSRGAQGILLVYDITNRWSFEGINRWVREVEEHAPGIPKVLVGNRLHLAFKRQVDPLEAEVYAERHNMGFYEISPLVNFNITESFQELCRMALKRNGMERLWRSNRVLSLHELCCHAIVGRTNGYGIDKLPLPEAMKANLKSYAMTTYPVNRQNYKTLKERKKRIRPPDATRTNCVNVSRKSCVIA